MGMIKEPQIQETVPSGSDMPSSCVSGKPTLTVMRQVAHLKSKGVRFDACTEEEAAEYLSRCNNYLRTTSYRALFPRQVEGPAVGNYIGLDFAHLVALSRIDRCLRSALREISADVEHFSKVKLLRLCEEHGEDGYGIVADFLASLNHAERRRLVGMLERRACEGEGHDMYTGDLIAHYGVGGLPVWVLVEVLEFGPFLTFYKFAAERWGLGEMAQEHYVLKSVKALRNAASHNSCIANGLVASGERAGYAPNRLITASLNEAGVRSTRSRRAKLRNLRVAQIASALYASSLLCSEAAQGRHAAAMGVVRTRFEESERRLGFNDGVVSFFEFLWKLVDVWLPVGR